MTEKTENLASILEPDLLRIAAHLDKIGYAIVPRRPTREMVMAGMISRGASNSYTEMLRKAPKLVGG